MNGSGDGSIVGVIETDAGDSLVSEIVDAVDAVEARAVIGEPEETTRKADLLVAPGEPALRALVRDGGYGNVPVLPIDVDPGVASVPVGAVDAAVAEAIEGRSKEWEHVVLSVSVGDESALAFRDVALVTDEPARISEFEIETGDVGRVAQIRADGIVIATPAGSHGYAAAADGPLLTPGSGIAIVPVAPFVTDADRWVVPSTDIACTVQRDETSVAVTADAEQHSTVGIGTTIRTALAGTVRTLEVPSSRHLIRE